MHYPPVNEEGANICSWKLSCPVQPLPFRRGGRGYLVDEELLHAGCRLGVGQSLFYVLVEEVRVEGYHLIEAEELVHLPRCSSACPEEDHGEGGRRRKGAEDEVLRGALFLLEQRTVQLEGELVVDLHKEPLGATHLRRGRRETLVVLGDRGQFRRRSSIVTVVAVMSMVHLVVGVRVVVVIVVVVTLMMGTAVMFMACVA